MCLICQDFLVLPDRIKLSTYHFPRESYGGSAIALAGR
jgi:hypothetical protein